MVPYVYSRTRMRKLLLPVTMRLFMNSDLKSRKWV